MSSLIYKIIGDNSSFKKSMNESIGLASSLQSKIAGIGATIGVSMGIEKVLQAGMAYEKAGIQLKTLTGSATQANQILNKLQEDALKSPFNLEAIVKVNNSLMSAGVSAGKAREDVKNLSNAIAATGGGNDELMRMAVNLQQIKNVGKATSVDIKQFAYAGINVYSVLDSYGKKHKINIDKQNISYETLTAALKDSAEAGGIYFGALENYANSTTGKISNLEDSVSKLGNTIFTALKPEINDILDGLSKLIKYIGDNIGMIKSLTGTILKLTGVFIAYKIVLKSIKFFTIAEEIGGVTKAMTLLNSVMSLNPFLVLGTAIIGATIALDGWNKAQKAAAEDKNKKTMSNAVITELDNVDRLTRAKVAASKKAGKSISEELAKQQVLDSELEKYSKKLEIKKSFDNKNPFGPISKITPEESAASKIGLTNLNLEGNTKAIYNALKSTSEDLKKGVNKGGSSGAPSKTETVRENITINIDTFSKVNVEAQSIKDAEPEITALVGNIFRQLFQSTSALSH